MAAVTYTAKRSLIAGHSADTDYSLDIPLLAARRSTAEEKDESVAQAGNVETLLHRIDVFWDCTTAAIDEADMAALREFIDSTAGGESFTLDIYGSVAVPDAPFAAKREGKGYSEDRVGRVARKYRVQFRVKAI